MVQYNNFYKIQKMSSSNKYKAEVLRLTQMLQTSFKQVQYYKKKDIEAQSLKQKIISQIDRLQVENKQLQQERDYYKENKSHQAASEAKKYKNEYDGILIVNKTKNYIEKVNEIIKQIAIQIKNKNRNKDIYAQNQHENNILALERAFAKASMGVIKYQQQSIKQAADKQLMKVQIDKLRKQNTYLYQMTAKLQQNFVQSDKITKKMHHEIKRLKQQNQRLTMHVEQLNKQLERKRTSASKKSLHSSSNDHPYATREYKQQYIDNQYRSQGSPTHTHSLKLNFRNHSPHSSAEHHGRTHLQLQEQINQLKSKMVLLQEQNDLLKNRQSQVNNSNSNRQIYSFRQISDSSDHIVTTETLADKKHKQKSDDMGQQMKRLTKQVKEYESTVAKLQQQIIKLKNKEHHSRFQGKQNQEQITIQQMRQKIMKLQQQIREKDGYIEELKEQIEHSEVEKDKIITVYQNQSNESKDKIIRHQDALKQLQKLVKSFKSKNEQLVKSNKLMAKQLFQKQKLLKDNEIVLQQKQQELQKVHCEREKQRLINELNNKNFEDVEQKDNKIKILELNLIQLSDLNRNLQNKLAKTEVSLNDQISILKKQMSRFQQKSQDSIDQSEMLRQDLVEKDRIIKQLQQTIAQVNKEVNQIAETWGIEDSKKILQAVGQKYRKQQQLIMDLTLHRERAINQKNNSQISFSEQKSGLQKQKQQLIKKHYQVLQQLQTLFNLKSIITPTFKSKFKRDRQNRNKGYKSEQNIDASFGNADFDIAEKWGKVVEQLQNYKASVVKQRQRMNQLQNAWWDKQNSMTEQLTECRRQISQYQTNIKLMQQQNAAKWTEIKQLKQKIKQSQHFNEQDKNDRVQTKMKKVSSHEQSFVQQYSLSVNKQNLDQVPCNQAQIIEDGNIKAQAEQIEKLEQKLEQQQKILKQQQQVIHNLSYHLKLAQKNEKKLEKQNQQLKCSLMAEKQHEFVDAQIQYQIDDTPQDQEQNQYSTSLRRQNANDQSQNLVEKSAKVESGQQFYTVGQLISDDSQQISIINKEPKYMKSIRQIKTIIDQQLRQQINEVKENITEQFINWQHWMGQFISQQMIEFMDMQAVNNQTTDRQCQTDKFGNQGNDQQCQTQPTQWVQYGTQVEQIQSKQQQACMQTKYDVQIMTDVHHAGQYQFNLQQYQQQPQPQPQSQLKSQPQQQQHPTASIVNIAINDGNQQQEAVDVIDGQAQTQLDQTQQHIQTNNTYMDQQDNHTQSCIQLQSHDADTNTPFHTIQQACIQTQDSMQEQQSETQDKQIQCQQIGDYEDDRERYAMQIQQYRMQQQQHMHQIIASNNEICSYRQQNVRLQQQVQQLSGCIVILQSNNAQYSENITQLQAANHTADKQVQEHQHKIQQLSQQITQIQQNKQQQQQQHNQCKTVMEHQIEQLQSVLKQKSSSYQCANTRIKQLQNTVDRISRQSALQIRALNEQLQQIGKQKSNAINMVADCIREQQPVLQGIINKYGLTICKMVQQLNNRHQQLQQNLHTIHSIHQHNRQKQKLKQQQKQKQQSTQPKIQQQFQQQQIKHSQLLKQMQARHRKQTHQLLTEIKELQQKVQQLEDGILEKERQLRDQEDDGHSRVRQLQHNMNSSRHQYQTQMSQVPILKSELQQLKSQLTIKNNEKQQLLQKLQLQQQKQANLTSQLSSITKELKKLQESIKKLQNINIVSQKQIKMYKQDLQQLQHYKQMVAEMQRNQQQSKAREQKNQLKIQQLFKTANQRNEVINKLRMDIGEYMKRKSRQHIKIDQEQNQQHQQINQNRGRINMIEGSSQTGQEEEQRQTRIKQQSSRRKQPNIENAEEQDQKLALIQLKKSLQQKQRELILRQEEINSKISQLGRIQSSIEQKQSNPNQQFDSVEQYIDQAPAYYMKKNMNSNDKQIPVSEKHAQSIRPAIVTKKQRDDKKTISFQNPQPQKLQLALKPNLEHEQKQDFSVRNSKGIFSYRTTKQQALEKQLKIIEQYRELLILQNKNLKKQIVRKDKICNKIKQIQKQLSKARRCIDKLNGEIQIKDKLLSKYDKQFKIKLQENIKLKRTVENLAEELQLQKKRNKNFEDLYDKYKMQKKAIISSNSVTNPE